MKKHYRHENNCLNCGTILDGKFCHNCGQENLEIKESFGHMMNHAISDYFHFDEQFFHTLRPLIFKPGYLTNEYMAGRRAQYLHPVKMYIFISLVYFVLLFQSGHEKVKPINTKGHPISAQKIIDSVNGEINANHNISAIRKKQLQREVLKYGGLSAKYGRPNDNGFAKISTSGDTTLVQYREHQNKLPPGKRDGFISRTLTEKVLSYKEKYGSRAQEVFTDELKHNTPKIMFFLLPLFALMLHVTFFRSKKYYVEDLIYTFHLHCFLFTFLAFIMLFQLLIPDFWGVMIWVDCIATGYIIWYIYKSLRVVYKRSRFRTITKIAGMSFAYFFVTVFGLALLLFITALTAA